MYLNIDFLYIFNNIIVYLHFLQKKRKKEKDNKHYS